MLFLVEVDFMNDSNRVFSIYYATVAKTSTCFNGCGCQVWFPAEVLRDTGALALWDSHACGCSQIPTEAACHQ